MRLPRAYRSLARPSSVSEPSHPPDGTATPKQLNYTMLNSLFVCLLLYFYTPCHPTLLSSVRTFWPCVTFQFTFLLNWFVNSTLQSNSASKDTYTQHHLEAGRHKTNHAYPSHYPWITGAEACCLVSCILSTPSPLTV